MEEASEVLCLECSVVWCRDFDTRRNEEKTTGSICDGDMEKDGSCKIDTQNKKDRVGEGRIILQLIKKMAGTLA